LGGGEKGGLRQKVFRKPEKKVHNRVRGGDVLRENKARPVTSTQKLRHLKER